MGVSFPLFCASLFFRGTWVEGDACTVPPCFFFFLFYHYSCATYLDHGECTIRFLAADRARRHSASSPCALRPALPERKKRK